MFGVNSLEWEIQKLHGAVFHSEISVLVSFLVSFFKCRYDPIASEDEERDQSHRKGGVFQNNPCEIG